MQKQSAPVLLRIVFVALGMLVLVLLPARGMAASITINDFSFEAAPPGPQYDHCASNSSWTCTGVSGIYTPLASTNYTAGSDGVSGVVPDGSQAAFAVGTNLSGVSISQTTSELIAAGTTYTLTVYSGCRVDAACDSKSWTGAGVQVELFAGTLGNIVATSGALASPGAGQWAPVTLTYTPLAGDIGSFLGVNLVTGSNSLNVQNNWDDVTMTSSASTDTTPVPEPGSIALLGTGICGIVWRLRRRLA